LAKTQDRLKAAATALITVAADNAALRTTLADIGEGGQKYTSFRSAQDLLTGFWKTRMCDIATRWAAYQRDPVRTSDPFTKATDTSCSFAFSRTRVNAVTLSRSDRMPGTASTAPDMVLSVNVECTSPFSVSIGVAFGTLAQRVFAIQPVATPAGSPTTTNEFVLTSSSTFYPLPLAMANARFLEFSDAVSLHASFGLAGNVRSGTTVGSDVAFLVGPSLGLFRTMFITPGILIGSEPSLGASFRVGDPVPAAITTPPVQTGWRCRFGVAVSFTTP
jgi:hypothetical protein